ncbi:MAG: Lipid II flippase MurJ [Stenotrophomonas maltophilia]|nr:MAG: Lipid II flippase MurJ [Stenotrophomonas maltophilia]
MLGRSTLWLSLATLTGLGAGFAREWLLIHDWGASNQSDAFLIALFLPEALRMALASGLITSAALPLYQRFEATGRVDWLHAMTLRFILAGVAVSLLLGLGAPLWVRIVGPGLNADALALAQGSLAVLAWCVPGFLLQALLSVPLQAQSRFVLVGLGSLLFNLPPVIYLAVAGTQATPLGAAQTCLLGSLLMPLVLFPALWRQQWRPWRVRHMPGAGRELLSHLGPLLASNLASQGLALLERMVASLLGEGAVAWVNLARKLVNLPLIALLSLNQVLLSLMSQAAGEARLQLLKRGLSISTLLTVPAALGLIGATPALVQLLFPRQGPGTPLPELLAWYGVPLLFGAWNSLLARFAYADGDTRLPLKCELIGSVLNAVLLGVLPFVIGLKGIPIAMMFGLTLTSVLLMQRQNLLGEAPWLRQWLLALPVMLLGALVLHPIASLWLQLGASVAASLAVLVGLALWTKPWRN